MPGRFARWLYAAALLPLASPVSLLAEWGIAFWSLGHAPVAGIDDPKSLSSVPLHYASSLLSAALPAEALLFWGVWLYSLRTSLLARDRTRSAVAWAASCIVVYAVITQYPWDWWLD